MERGTKLALAALAGVGIAVLFGSKASASGGADPRNKLASSKNLLQDVSQENNPRGGGSYASKNAWGKDAIKAYQERLNDAAGTIKYFFDKNAALVGDAKPPLVAFDPQGAWGTWGPKTQATSDAFIKVLNKAVDILRQEVDKSKEMAEDVEKNRFRYIQAMVKACDDARSVKGSDLTAAEIEQAIVKATYEFDVDKLYMSQQDYWAFRAAALALSGTKNVIGNLAYTRA